MTNYTAPLAGVRVLDFTTQLPGPLATKCLELAGAEVVRIEPPGGDPFCSSPANGAVYAALNDGKRRLELNLKQPDAVKHVLEMASAADVLVEQFRPGVMERLGLGPSLLRRLNSRLIYCSITGYGQTGCQASMAGHDLNYWAETGALWVVTDKEGMPILPALPVADIGGGSYPAIINILLALMQRHWTGEGCHIDISMTHGLLPFLYSPLAALASEGKAPAPNSGTFTGGSPRYRVYRTADDRFLAVAAVEDKFWRRFCELIGLSDVADTPEATVAVTRIISSHSAHHWEHLFEGEDVCCNLVRSVDEAIKRLCRDVPASGSGQPDLFLPVQPMFRRY